MDSPFFIFVLISVEESSRGFIGINLILPHLYFAGKNSFAYASRSDRSSLSERTEATTVQYFKIPSGLYHLWRLISMSSPQRK